MALITICKQDFKMESFFLWQREADENRKETWSAFALITQLKIRSSADGWFPQTLLSFDRLIFNSMKFKNKLTNFELWLKKWLTWLTCSYFKSNQNRLTKTKIFCMQYDDNFHCERRASCSKTFHNITTYPEGGGFYIHIT